MLEPGDRLGFGHKPSHNVGTGMKAGQDHLEAQGRFNRTWRAL